MSKITDDPSYGVGRAEEVREMLDSILDEEMREILEDIAERYERIAEQTARRQTIDTKN